MSLAAYFFVYARPALSSDQAGCPYKNKHLVAAHGLRGKPPAKGSCYLYEPTKIETCVG
jgi:hypothetical protein